MKICKYIILLGCVFSIPLWAQLEGWGEERQLTNNSVADITPDVDVIFDKLEVVWISDDSIMLAESWYDTTWTDTIKLNSDSLINNGNPSINRAIVWKAQDDSRFGIHYRESYPYPCTTLVRIASSDDTLGHPHISNFNLYSDNRAVVWEGWDGSDWEIYFKRGCWEGKADSIVWDSIIALTDNDYDDRYPSILAREWYDSLFHDSICVVWEMFDGNDYEIMCRIFNGESWDSILPLTDNSIADRFPCVSEEPWYGAGPITIIWQKWDGQDWEICMRSNEGGIWSPETLLTDNSVDDEKPVLEWGIVAGGASGLISGIMVWQRWDGQDYEIIARVRDGTLWDAEMQLSEEDSLDDINPRVSMSPPCVKKWGYFGICVVWEGDDGNDKEIYYRLGYHPGGRVEESVKCKTQNAKLEISPNPFIHSTTIKYCLPAKSEVSIEIYDIGGKKIKELAKGIKSAGEHTTYWKTDNISNGVYFCVFKSEKEQLVKKFVVIK